MKNNRIVKRTVYDTVSGTVEYELTKMGYSFRKGIECDVGVGFGKPYGIYEGKVKASDPVRKLT